MDAQVVGAALPGAVVAQEGPQRVDQGAVVGAVVLGQGAEDSADQLPGVFDAKNFPPNRRSWRAWLRQAWPTPTRSRRCQRTTCPADQRQRRKCSGCCAAGVTGRPHRRVRVFRRKFSDRYTRPREGRQDN